MDIRTTQPATVDIRTTQPATVEVATEQILTQSSSSHESIYIAVGVSAGAVVLGVFMLVGLIHGFRILFQELKSEFIILAHPIQEGYNQCLLI